MLDYMGCKESNHACTHGSSIFNIFKELPYCSPQWLYIPTHSIGGFPFLHTRNAGKNYNEMSPHTGQNDHHKKSTNNKCCLSFYWVGKYLFSCCPLGMVLGVVLLCSYLATQGQSSFSSLHPRMPGYYAGGQVKVQVHNSLRTVHTTPSSMAAFPLTVIAELRSCCLTPP